MDSRRKDVNVSRLPIAVRVWARLYFVHPNTVEQLLTIGTLHDHEICRNVVVNLKNRCSSDGIVPCLRARRQKNHVSVHSKDKKFVFSKAFRRGVRPTLT
jgi:hypothetical protein